jgi:hypothetical protein
VKVCVDFVPLPGPTLLSLFNQLVETYRMLRWESIETDLLALPLSPYEQAKMERFYATAVNFIETEGRNYDECRSNLFDPYKFGDALRYLEANGTIPGAIIVAEGRNIHDAPFYSIMDGNHRFVALRYWTEHEHRLPKGQQRAWIGRPQS